MPTWLEYIYMYIYIYLNPLEAHTHTRASWQGKKHRMYTTCGVCVCCARMIPLNIFCTTYTRKLCGKVNSCCEEILAKLSHSDQTTQLQPPALEHRQRAQLARQPAWLSSPVGQVNTGNLNSNLENPSRLGMASTCLTDRSVLLNNLLKSVFFLFDFLGFF